MGQEWISVKQTLDHLEESERLFHAAVNSLIALIESIDRHTLSIHPELEGEYRRRLAAVRRPLRETPSPDALLAASQALDRDLAEHARGASAIFQQKREEVRQMLLVLADASETIQVRGTCHAERLRAFAARLETASRLDDLNQIRRSLSQQVQELNRDAESVERDNAGVVSRLQNEMSAIRRRLQHAEQLAETDSLTGLLNRRGMERKLAAAAGAGEPFSILLFDINRFKGINDRYGHLCGDEVLKAFARRLQTQFRDGDAVARWGGDEFLAVFPAALREAMARSRHIARAVCGSYSVKVQHREIRLEVSASIGLAEHNHGQPLEELFSAADALLYQGKLEEVQ